MKMKYFVLTQSMSVARKKEAESEPKPSESEWRILFLCYPFAIAIDRIIGNKVETI